MKRNYFSLDTKDDLAKALKRGAAVAAFFSVCTLLLVLIQYIPTYAVVDALLFGIGAWFILTKQSRVATGLVTLLYLAEVVGGSVDPKPGQMTPNVVTLFCLVMLVQAFRASLKWHKLVTVPKAILASEPMEPPVAFRQGVV